MDGYTEYKDIAGKRVNDFLSKHPITKKTARAWMRFGRTMELDGKIIKEAAMLKLVPKRKKTED